MGRVWITKHNCHHAHSVLVRELPNAQFDKKLYFHKFPGRCFALAAFLHVGAAPTPH